jgi:hypothetical protein
VLSFAQHKGREEKRRGGSTWWVLVDGEETRESLSTWPRAAAAQQSSESESREREREREEAEEGRGGRDAADDGRLLYIHQRRKKKTHGLLVGRFFSFSEALFSS